jgi:hypothetical protein
VRILFANWELNHPAGTETYLETVVPELVRLGHDVIAWSFNQGRVAERLERLGCAVPVDLDEVDRVDVIHAQQASCALAARARFPDTPLVYACHSWAYEIDEPPPLASPAALLAFNDRVLSRLEASALGERTPIHRLRQPVTISVMENARTPIRDHLGVAITLSRNLSERRPMLEAACTAVGAHLTVHTDTEVLNDSSGQIMSSDAVFCAGRTALETMALARAAFVFDEAGSVGFVTADRYSDLESSGFDVAIGTPPSVEALVAELRGYDPELGVLGRELVLRHHTAPAHAAQLVAIYHSALAAPPTAEVPRDAIADLAVMTQRVFFLEQRVRQLEWLHADVSRYASDVSLRASERARELDRELDRFRSSTSWRVTRPLRALRRRTDDHG